MILGENARMRLVPHICTFRTRVSTLEDGPLCAINVGKHSGINLYLLYTRRSILEKEVISLANTENSLGIGQLAVNMKRLILCSSSTCAANVGNP